MAVIGVEDPWDLCHLVTLQAFPGAKDSYGRKEAGATSPTLRFSATHQQDGLEVVSLVRALRNAIATHVMMIALQIH